MQPRQVRDVMTRRVVTATVDTPVEQLARLLAVHRVSAVPVVDADRRVLGTVSEADLAHGATGTAGEVMSVRPPTVAADAPLSVAAMKLEHSTAGRLLVTGDDGRLLGVVSRAGVLRPLTRPDTAIRDAVERVLRRTLLIDPGRVRVDVHDGAVTLTGTVARRTTAGMAARLAGHVRGVTAVVDRIHFEVDDTAGPARTAA
ncbi:CBS domain-containing protein [Virgisporangium ochraceum]|uniref:Histidine kinase n=1 Tax=Virgisporangium ochraceum TaxID=65505 RepID=A0A8J4A274_9ACTN|nr:CBS domain-containing protein [Virgisporangium ochraceum]GIJ73816.1 histidine kinase [Virgisporangium ochraceum]